MTHYNLEYQTPEVQKLAAEYKLPGPIFVGQGLTYSVGSDSYGYYIVARKLVGNKVIFGIAGAKTAFSGSWTEGTMNCSIDIDTAKPTEWITSFGTRRDRNGELHDKWWFCDENGKRFNGKRCTYGFNGAHAYRDPSF